MKAGESRVWQGAVGWSVLLHLLIGLSLLLSLERDQPIDAASQDAPGPVIQATSIDARELDAAHEALAERQRQREEAVREAQREAERRAREEAEARQAAEAQRERQAREAERQRQQEAEEQRRRQEAEAQRQAEEEEARRQAEAEERRRQEELERQRAEEARRQQEAEEAMRRAAEDEERQRQAATLKDQYGSELRHHVERNWIEPSDVPEDLSCVVRARLIPGGEVVGVRIGRCNASASVARTIESAVYRASPMPPPPEGLEFSGEIDFIFTGDSR